VSSRCSSNRRFLVGRKDRWLLFPFIFSRWMISACIEYELVFILFRSLETRTSRDSPPLLLHPVVAFLAAPARTPPWYPPPFFCLPGRVRPRQDGVRSGKRDAAVCRKWSVMRETLSLCYVDSGRTITTTSPLLLPRLFLVFFADLLS